ncbi:MAG TPA: hypothetical protein PLG59_17955 [bacterium]|nr:hypothetical protein [bacterium]HQO36553.1 hypothetical protein [bacterium]HQP97879.1 hypothetical protein [bacterium]
MPESNEFSPILTPIADFFANILRVPGGIFRDILVSIDITMAKGVFIAYFTLLIIWVLLLKREEVLVTNERTGKTVSLRPYAVLALLSQVIIYLIY